MNLISYPFSEKPPFGDEQKVIVSLESQYLSTHSLSLPDISNSQAKLAITHILEDELLQPLDEVLIFPNKENNDTWSAIVISGDIFSNVKRELIEQKINCLSLVPDFMLLPVIEGKITYIEQGDFVLFRTSKFSGGKINKDIFFQLYQNDKLQPENLGEHYDQFNLLSVNLWQKYGKNIKPFQLSISLLAGLFLLNLISLGIDNQQLSKRLEAQNTHNRTLFKSTFPDTRIVDLQVQLNNKLTQINKWQRLLERDLLLAMSKHKFDNNTKSIEFKNNKLQVSK